MASSGIPQIDELIRTLTNASAPPEQRAQAKKQLETLAASTPQYGPKIAVGLQDYGLTIANGQIVSATMANAGTGQSNMSSAAQAAVQTKWSRANQELQTQKAGNKQKGQSIAATNTNQSGTPGATLVGDWQGGGNGGGTGLAGDVGGNGVGSQDWGGADYSNTFFGNTDPLAINDLAANPRLGWNMFMAQGGPNGSGLRNTGMAKYGADEFQAAYDLAPYLNGPNSGPAEKLGFVDQMMGRAGSGGGQYIDPSKILNQLFSKLGADPSVANQEEILNALDAIQPFMDETQYRMMRNRIQPIIDQYMTAGMTNVNQDMSGMLLQALQGAITG